MSLSGTKCAVHADVGEGADDPVVEEGVGPLEAQALDERARHDERVGDAVAGLHEHRPAAGDAPHDVDAVPVGAVGVDLVAHDWNEPMTTSGLSQSQKRSVGGRSPDPTSRAITSSSATCIAGCSTRAGMTSKAWSCQPVALPRARRTAMPTASGVKPMSATVRAQRALDRGRRAASTPASTGIPRSAALMSSRASSGSRKKSPDTLTSAEPPAVDLEVDCHELASGNLVLTTHACHNNSVCR